MPTLPPKIVALDQIEPIPGPGSLTWHPVRWTLGIRAFGCNAYTATNVGEDVVEPHTEAPEHPSERDHPELMHEELYFVATGRATFTIDRVEYDAPAGTYVFIPDPDSHRHAVAAEAPTTVLSFGGPPTFTPSAWEWGFRSSPLMRTDPERARAILEEGLATHPESASLRYNLACLEALSGERDKALTHLRQALTDDPKLREWAAQDLDLTSLRADPEFIALLAEQ